MNSHNAELPDKKEGKTIWMSASGAAVGGAESRMIKVASSLAESAAVRSIRLLITPELHRSYDEHATLGIMIKHPKIDIIREERKKSLFERFLKKLYKLSGISWKWLDQTLLVWDSWLHIYEKWITNDEEILHCYMGDEARNGAVLFSCKHKNKVIVEITTHRYLERVTSDLSRLLEKGNTPYNLTTVCVSLEVFKNWNRYLDQKKLNEKNIDNRAYKGAFFSGSKKKNHVQKENVIIFPHRFVGPKNGVLFSEVTHELFHEGKLNGWKVLFRGRGLNQEKMEETLQPWIDQGYVEIGFTNNLFEDLQRSKIAVSLIETGSYPSQSIFEAMQAGCALLLSDSGNTKNEFEHKHIHYTTLEKDIIKQDLIRLIKKGDPYLQIAGSSMNTYYEWFKKNRNQLQEVKSFYNIHEIV